MQTRVGELQMKAAVAITADLLCKQVNTKRTVPMLNYEKRISAALDRVHSEGRYRVFAEIRRSCGAFPAAEHLAHGKSVPITVWCSNDYLGMGQSEIVRQAMHMAIDAVGAGSGGTRNISGTTHYHVDLEGELAELHGK
jgi:5-aminolevulinate synthase